MANATEEAARIRAEFKRRGWNSRQVSVQSDYYSLGSSIRVTVKDASVPFYEVQRIAEGAESIRRCEVTGDILGGGNRYVSVTHSREAQATLALRHVQAIEDALDRLAPGDTGTLLPVGADGLVGRNNEHTAALWVGGSFKCQFCPTAPEQAAYALALTQADQQASA